MGFCFINNVAVAALHALTQHGLERVAIVDFDVHHGNGTQDIVAADERILMVGFFSIRFIPSAQTSLLLAICSTCPFQPIPGAQRSASSFRRIGCRGCMRLLRSSS